MSFLTQLLAGPVLNFASGVIDRFVPDPQKALEAKLEMSKLVSNQEIQEMANQKEVIMAEAKGESWLQRNWRPLTALMFSYIIFHNYILNPYLMLFFKMKIDVELPSDIWEILKICLGGYMFGRTAEKIVPGIVDVIKGNKK